jgi:predicted transcriptional regulator
MVRVILKRPTLAKIIKIISDHEDGISTSDLLHELRVTMYGLKILRQAAEEKYVERKNEGQKVKNYLTPKGKKLAELYKQLDPDH